MRAAKNTALREDHHLSGIVLMCLAMFFLASMDASAKWLASGYSLAQIIFFRSLIALAIIIPFSLRESGRTGFQTRRPGLHLLRAGFMAGASFLFFFAISRMNLADATAIVLTAPLMITALSAPILGERVGLRRWIAVALGFTGVLIILRPGFGVFRPEGLLVLIVAFFYSMIMITNRLLRHTESLTALSVYPQLGPLIVSAGLIGWYWQTPASNDYLIFILIGILAGAAHLLLTLAFRYAPAAVIAPFDYTSLAWATVYGYIFWHEIPDNAAFSGMLLIASAGLFIIYRERKMHRPVPENFPQEPH